MLTEHCCLVHWIFYFFMKLGLANFKYENRYFVAFRQQSVCCIEMPISLWFFAVNKDKFPP